MDAIKILFFKYKNVIPNVRFFMELMDLMPNKAVTKFQEEFFLQILGIVMGTNLAPILANIYMAMLEELYIICKNKNKIWPEFYKKKNFLNGFFEFNSRRENLFIDKWHFGNKVAGMDLYIQGK